MLLLNGKQFLSTSKDPDTAIQRNHYTESVKLIKETYGQKGRNKMVVLVRRKEQKRDNTGKLEETPPMVFPAKAYPAIQFAFQDDKEKENKGGSIESWAYSERRAIKKNNQDQLEPDPKSIKFMSHFQGYDMDTQMELIYFLLFKSPKVWFPPAHPQGKVKKGDLMVDDPGLRAKEKIAKERNILKLKNAILAPDSTFPLYSDKKLRQIAAAWGLDGAQDEFQSVDDLRIRLEDSVKRSDEVFKKTGKGKGVTAFLEMIEFDESVRRRSMIQWAMDNEVIKWSDNKYLYISTGDMLLEVPPKEINEPFDYLATHLSNSLFEKEWGLFKREVISVEYLEMLAYDELKWLARQDDLPVVQKSKDALREDLGKIYCSTE